MDHKFEIKPWPKPRWSIDISPGGAISITLRNDNDEVTDQHELTATQVCRALNRFAEAAEGEG